jgi:hypothetical protein
MFSLNRFFLLILFCLTSIRSFSYSVLTHEAIVDAVWEETIVPALLAKYPEENNQEALKKAKAYAYGGAIMPDMGYFPFGNKMFTDLIHYVRGGDFVTALLDEAGNMNELAFAYGALAHYTSDNYGHPIGVNPSVPMLYPKLKKRHGDTVTYEQNPISHKRVEFAFDVIQLSRGKHAPTAYHNFIGFEVAEEHLKRAFLKTYCISIDELFSNFASSLNIFRWSVTTGFPILTKAAWKAQKGKVEKANRAIEKKKLMQQFDSRNYRHEWKKHYKKPGIMITLLAGVITVLPKVGPLRVLKFQTPNNATEQNFVQSFEISLFHLNRIVKSSEMQNALENKDYDTGKHSHHGEYCLADGTYLNLINKLRKKKYEGMNEPLRQNILSYFGKPENSLSRSMQPILEEIRAVNY